MNGRRMLRASAACEEPATWTKPQGATGGVPGVNGVGDWGLYNVQGTHTHRYFCEILFQKNLSVLRGQSKVAVSDPLALSGTTFS